MFRFLDRLGQEAARSADADEILTVTTRLTAEHLGLTNCAYADMDADQDGFTIRGNWHAPGSPSIVGHYQLADFGTLAVQELRAGRPLIINDNLKEIAPHEAKTFQDIGIAATICMPLFRGGRLLALMAIHDRGPHYWTPYELKVIREVTDRSWAHVQRVRAEAELRASNERFRAAVAATSGVLWTNDAAGRMVGEQTGWATLTGQQFAEYQGYGWASAVHPDDAQPTIDAWNEAVDQRKMFVFEHRVRRLDGQWRRFSIRAVPVLGEQGEVTEWVGVHTDITEQRAADEALREQSRTLEQRVDERTAELNTANEALAQSQKLQALGELTGGIAHDFNNLMTVVAGSADFLLRRPDIADDKRRKYLQAIADTSERAISLTDQLLAFGRRQAIKPEIVDVDLTLDAFSEVLSRTLGSRIEVSLDLAASPSRIEVDPTQLETAVLNAAVNARDAMQGGGRLIIRTRREADGDSEVLRLSIIDNGLGMPQRVVERAFEPFFTTKPIGKGTGLGLSQIHGFAAQAGGRAEIESREGDGTTISILLPITERTAAEQIAPDRVYEMPAGQRILLVEDNPRVREFAEELLRDLGCQVLSADGADEALLILESSSVDLMLTDVVMPGTNGVELARKVREMLPELPILLATGYSAEILKHQPEFVVLPKPYGAASLTDAMAKVLSATRPD